MKTYTSVIKTELCKLPLKENCCSKAELLGVICFGSYLKNNALCIRVENATVAKRVFSLIRIVTKETPSLYKTEYNNKTMHIVQISDETIISHLLETFRLIKFARNKKSYILFSVSDDFIEKQCCKQAFLRGAFLMNGTLTDPDKQYHLELSTNHRRLLKDTQLIMGALSLTPKTLSRKNMYLMYFKDSESIFYFLGNIGATKNMLDFQNVRILKEINNNMNRAINCEEANRRKTEQASVLHIEAIEKIDRTIGIDALESGLRELAYLRIEYPDISLKELGEIISTPMSRSGINHRLKKLLEIADSIKEKE